MAEVITVILSIVMIVVFFIMSSNIGDLKRLAQRQVKQNDEIISLLKRSAGLLTDEEKAKAFDASKKK